MSSAEAPDLVYFSLVALSPKGPSDIVCLLLSVGRTLLATWLPFICSGVLLGTCFKPQLPVLGNQLIKYLRVTDTVMLLLLFIYVIVELLQVGKAAKEQITGISPSFLFMQNIHSLKGML